MTTYYVGPGGNDGNNGTTWALRKLTLNGAEDIPVVAADIVYIAPGVYRELLTVDVSGAAGQPIIYIGDVTGEHTDGVGGIVRITGSDNDQSATRANCITATTKTYRTFQGFMFDTTTSYNLACITGCTNITISDCFFLPGLTACVYVSGLAQSTFLIQRCLFMVSGANQGIYFIHSAVVDGAAHIVQNCVFMGGAAAIQTTRVGGFVVKNCTFMARPAYGIRVETAITVGQTITVNNCIFYGVNLVLVGTVAGEIVENYNTFYGNGTDRTNTNVGANSVAYPALLNPPILLAGIRYPWVLGALSDWSAVQAIAGTGEAIDDFFGQARPATAAKNSWGAVQFADVLRETGTVHAGSVSIKFEDAGRHQIFVPTTAVETTISVYVYREADYAGTNPQMVIRQPGVAARTTTDAGAAAGWNQLTDTFTPAASPPYVVVELVSNNTNTANPTTNDVFFDDLVVS